MTKRTERRPSDLPTKIVRSADGSVLRMKVVQSESETLEDDLLAAFRSNVRRIVTERRKRTGGAKNAA
jgi:L-rhamnose isomerase